MVNNDFSLKLMYGQVSRAYFALTEMPSVLPTAQGPVNRDCQALTSALFKAIDECDTAEVMNVR